jgi:GDPmannose 4,6-dehydratase
MKKKIALIFGINGQDGSYLSRFLLKKKYKVFGVIRRSSNFNTQRIDDIHANSKYKNLFKLLYGDVTDSLSVMRIIQKIKPNEIYNLAAQSHVQVSFEVPEYTAQVDALGALRILEAIKLLNFKKTKFYQAGTSEMFGKSLPPQNELTNLQPQSPYAAAKLYAHWITVCYRESYKLFACNGILFNHESPLRGGTFVTKKIINGLCKIKYKKQNILYLGNLYSKRDWGYAKDYVESMWKMLQKKKPDDYVICSGKSYSVKEFINLVADELKMIIVWKGKGLKEVGYFNKKPIIRINRKYFRPLEVNHLKGDSSKARKILKWTPKNSIKNLIKKMINFEINEIQNI